MTDLEMVKRCAELAEVWKTAHELYPTMTLDPTFSGVEIRGQQCILVPKNPMRQDPQVYDPIADDVQAMALVRQFGISVRRTDPDMWDAWIPLHPADGSDASLNRAIVRCVASMEEKPSPDDIGESL